ncbi:MAG TPA: DUF3999 family protein [Candidatus Elarobacter sp.]
MSLDAGAAWAAWTTALPVVSAPAPDARYLRATIPFAIAPDANGDYPDLRVVDARDNEVPYVIDPQRAAAPPRTLTPIDTGFVPHRWTQAVFDLGPEGSLVGTIRLSVDETRRETYLNNVALDASDDRTTWRVVRDDAVIYHVDGHGCTTIAFPPSRSRWLRVRVLDARSPFPIDGAIVERGDLPIPEPGLAPLPLDAIPADATAADAVPNRQLWLVTSATPIRPSAVAFSGGTSTFERHVIVQSSDEGVSWDTAGSDIIARWPDGGKQTSFVFTERTARRWRIIVENFNDRPIAGLRPQLLARAHTLVVPAGFGAPYRVLSGNPAASAPVYDLGDQLAHARWTAAPATIATVPLAIRTQPLTPRGASATLLTAVLTAIGVVLGAVAVWTLRGGEASA